MNDYCPTVLKLIPTRDLEFPWKYLPSIHKDMKYMLKSQHRSMKKNTKLKIKLELPNVLWDFQKKEELPLRPSSIQSVKRSMTPRYGKRFIKQNREIYI